MTVSHHNASTARFYALRLLPGQEVFSQLHAFVQQNQLHAAWIAGCTGSLTDVALRYAGQEATTSLTGTFEVISLNGTLELTGEHLHLAVSIPTGHARRPYDARVYRAYHAGTGYRRAASADVQPSTVRHFRL